MCKILVFECPYPLGPEVTANLSLDSKYRIANDLLYLGKFWGKLLPPTLSEFYIYLLA